MITIESLGYKLETHEENYFSYCLWGISGKEYRQIVFEKTSDKWVCWTYLWKFKFNQKFKKKKSLKDWDNLTLEVKYSKKCGDWVNNHNSLDEETAFAIYQRLKDLNSSK